MSKKVFIGLTTYFLMFAFFAAFVGEVNAQPRNAKKPNDRAKRLAAQGDQLFNQKDYRSAINKYAEAIVISPNYPAAHYWKGYAHYYLDEYDAAAEDLDMAFNQGHPRLEIYKIRWYVNFQKRNYDAALEDVQQGLRLEPSNVVFTSALGDIYLGKQDFQNAIASYKKSIELDPNNGDVYYFLALSYAQTGDYTQQRLMAIEAVKKNTGYAGESYRLIGDALSLAKKPADAILAYERALNVKPDSPVEVYTFLAGLYQSQSRLNDAVATAKKGVQLYPNDGNLFISLTWFYSLAERHNEAVGTGVQAIKLVPNEYMAYTNLCRAYNDTKQYSQAIATCNKALNLSPDDGETYYYLARAHDLTNKPDQATQYYKKAVIGLIEFVRNNPDSADAYYLLGNAYFADDQTGKAIEAFKKSLQLSPNFARAHYNIGYMYFLENNMTAARDHYNKLTKLDAPLAEKLKQAMKK